MTQDRILVQITGPADHVGDIMGYLSSVGGWLEGCSETDPTRVLARVPRDTFKSIEDWVAAELPRSGYCEVLPGRVGNV